MSSIIRVAAVERCAKCGQRMVRVPDWDGVSAFFECPRCGAKCRDAHATVNLEQAIRQHLAQWAHRRCGGQPVTMAARKQLRCSVCAAQWPWQGTLGKAVQAVAKDFYSLVLK